MMNTNSRYRQERSSMLRANHIEQGSCYTSTLTRKWLALRMLANSYRVLSGTTLLERIDEIASTFGSTDKEQDRVLFIIWSLDSPTLDAARICICFENFFKAELLLKGYIIHRIDKAALTPTYRYLAADQKTRPIKITEIKLAEGLRWKRNNNYSFQTLTPFTIEFTL